MTAKMRIAATAALLCLAAGCSTATDPLISCDGNPKCKADTQPSTPLLPKLQPSPAAAGGR